MFWTNGSVRRVVPVDSLGNAVNIGVCFFQIFYISYPGQGSVVWCFEETSLKELLHRQQIIFSFHHDNQHSVTSLQVVH